ncbi:hypothetical protein XAP412_870042 [Xanthomonas phaseoli pv. phaseoli]|uniref:Secreted protein n=1 Tax=Xanthomonas campestris pv. phaseoli TaxID=317013 RepID=A0AB38E5V2_XANCH|nr:hypothetical protein XAP6984_900041 [Xanthomonas phaseoli pv. phaseoli]SON91184.1 hypothetical protein XAP412_870042 [Xanthomonas phaseoli pv. phaseoli]SON92841.1 hypothetical protein XAP7430_890041 [Xanthomonas phaseoli pv. phaseoli]
MEGACGVPMPMQVLLVLPLRAPAWHRLSAIRRLSFQPTSWGGEGPSEPRAPGGGRLALAVFRAAGTEARRAAHSHA